MKPKYNTVTEKLVDNYRNLTNQVERFFELTDETGSPLPADSGLGLLKSQILGSLERIRDLEKPPERVHACPDCGCTDVQGSAWVDVGDEYPGESCYCPQCASWGLAGAPLERELILVENLEPFSHDRKIPRELADDMGIPA